jgi:hypothetical protein
VRHNLYRALLPKCPAGTWENAATIILFSVPEEQFVYSFK